MEIIKEGKIKPPKKFVFWCDKCSGKYSLMSDDSKMSMSLCSETYSFSHYTSNCPFCNNCCASPDYRRQSIYLGVGFITVFILILIFCGIMMKNN